MNKIKEVILDIFLPKHCIGCKKEGQYICDNCELFLSETPNSINNLFTVWEYEGIIEKAIWKIKYDGMFHIVDELVEKALRKFEFNLPSDMCITYVPMFREKERYRGFNQSELIAKKIDAVLSPAKDEPSRVVPLLTKIKDNKSQVGLSPKERLENVKGAFRLTSDVNATTSEVENVLLVDDVYTTGATVNECCKVLRKGGAKNIWIFVLARKLTI